MHKGKANISRSLKTSINAQVNIYTMHTAHLHKYTSLIYTMHTCTVQIYTNIHCI